MPSLRSRNAAGRDNAGADRNRPRAGKARYVGFSEWPAGVIAEAARDEDVAASSQASRNIRCSGGSREGCLPLWPANGISQVVWSPLAQGVLTGKYRPGEALAQGTRATSRAMGGFLQRSWLEPRVLEAVRRVKPIAKEAGLSLSQFALAWVLRIGNVASAIIGATRPAQVEENVRASGHYVDPSLFQEAERTLANVATA